MGTTLTQQEIVAATAGLKALRDKHASEIPWLIRGSITDEFLVEIATTAVNAVDEVRANAAPAKPSDTKPQTTKPTGPSAVTSA